ncbi:hypothetical protein LIER_19356 [Lithospermum erythrorhizon]|uniref:RRM domain-containing protein n=1 Tax=Lithospermum erythrorhizon TaxID=34254 RepID=A0AAV3QK35_LITER
MADNNEVEEQVDLDDDNYIDEDEDPEQHIEDEGAGEAIEENVEVERDDIRDENHGDSMKVDRGDMGSVSTEGEEKPCTSVSKDDEDKHVELLARPSHGSEVFIGGLPRDVSEDDLTDLCEKFGDIFEIKIMKNKDTGESKGFAFVAFKTKDVAQKAIEELHNTDFKGKNLRCSLSETKYKLFIGNVPKNWSDDEFKKVLNDTGPGVVSIELIKDPQNPSRNRGFAFVEYFNNACADYSRQKMSATNFKLDSNSPTVTWADPKSTQDHSAAASEVKALYIKNIPEATSTEQLKELFQRHGEVTKVVMPPSKSGGKGGFGFVHYAERSSALKAVQDTEKYEIDGHTLEVVLARPQIEKRFDAGVLPGSFPLPNTGYGGYPINSYTPLSTGYGAAAAGFQQPMIYGRGPMPAGMQMVPMMLPDGRIGYVLQPPGAQMPPASNRSRSRRNGAEGHHLRGGGSRGSRDDTSRSRRYRPY